MFSRSGTIAFSNLRKLLKIFKTAQGSDVVKYIEPLQLRRHCLVAMFYHLYLSDCWRAIRSHYLSLLRVSEPQPYGNPYSNLNKKFVISHFCRSVKLCNNLPACIFCLFYKIGYKTRKIIMQASMQTATSLGCRLLDGGYHKIENNNYYY